jgi:hypothetical protein
MYASVERKTLWIITQKPTLSKRIGCSWVYSFVELFQSGCIPLVWSWWTWTGVLSVVWRSGDTRKNWHYRNGSENMRHPTSSKRRRCLFGAKNKIHNAKFSPLLFRGRLLGKQWHTGGFAVKKRAHCSWRRLVFRRTDGRRKPQVMEGLEVWTDGVGPTVWFGKVKTVRSWFRWKDELGL